MEKADAQFAIQISWIDFCMNSFSILKPEYHVYLLAKYRRVFTDIFEARGLFFSINAVPVCTPRVFLNAEFHFQSPNNLLKCMKRFKRAYAKSWVFP